MGDLFWNKVAGVLIGGILVIIVIKELGHVLVPSHPAHELDAHNTAYPVDWAALEGDGAGETETVEEGPTDYGLLLANASLSAGERITRRCQSCHTFDEGGASGSGPNLWNMVGKDIAARAGFSYSNALQGIDGGWSYEALDAFLESPRNFANGTAMSFAGLRDEEDRMDLIAYLRSLSNNPMDLPAALESMPANDMEEAMDDGEEMMDMPVEEETEADQGGH